MKVWQKTAIITLVIFALGVLGAGWTYRPIVDYYISNPPETLNVRYGKLSLTLMAKNRGKTDVSLDLVVTVENANISVSKIEPWMEFNENELKIHVTLQSEMEGHSIHNVYVDPTEYAQNFTVKYSIANRSGFSISGIIGRLFLEAKRYYATLITYNRTDTDIYELVK